jgi:sugar phosphate isomerase/epimerase
MDSADFQNSNLRRQQYLRMIQRRTMRIACQLSLAGRGTIAQQFQWLKDWGYEGVEITPWEYLDGDRCKYALSTESEVKAAMDKTGLPVTTICGGIHFEFLHPDADKRRADVARLKALLHMAGRLGATGIIMVPIFNGTPTLPDLWPVKSSLDAQQELLLAELRHIAPVAEESGACVILEPLNRYEAPWFNRLEQAAAICDELNSPGIGFMADLFHMNIEETNPAGAIRKHGRWLKHVHLADNTRKQPGTGITDFQAAFAALRDIGFSGAMALECGLTGEPGAVLPECMRYLKACGA